MKKIIDGKKYDTETAEYLRGWSNDYAVNDFNYCEEALYRKKTGEYFLFGEGGPLSKYREHFPDGWGSGCDITPLTEDEAKAWAMDHLDCDSYESIWGEVEE